ncbi:9552_t:CDS:2, partial [Gigaspora margarita]
QWPQISCVLCECLLYFEKAIYDLLVTYPLQQYILGVLLFFNPNINQITKPRVPTYKSCKNPTTRFLFPYLFPIPEEIISVSLHKRKYLSLVNLYYSLERISNSNPYAEYRSLTGTMTYGDYLPTDQEIDEIIDSCISENTRKATKKWVKALNRWRNNIGYCYRIETITSKNQLEKEITEFFCSVRKIQDG